MSTGQERDGSMRPNSPTPSETSSNLSLNTTFTSFNSSRFSVPDNRSQNKLKNSLKNVETSLEGVLKKLSRPPLLQAAFPAPEPDALETHLRKFLERFSSSSCITVIENLRENANAVLETQKEYLASLQDLLQDACQPLNTHGLSDGHIGSIYGTLISLSKVETEMACRVQALDAVVEALETMEEPNEDTIAQAGPREFAAAENLGEIFKLKFDEFLNGGSNIDRLRIRAWRKIVESRSMAENPLYLID
jgi:hypothetical protein